MSSCAYSLRVIIKNASKYIRSPNINQSSPSTHTFIQSSIKSKYSNYRPNQHSPHTLAKFLFGLRSSTLSSSFSKVELRSNYTQPPQSTMALFTRSSCTSSTSSLVANTGSQAYLRSGRGGVGNYHKASTVPAAPPVPQIITSRSSSFSSGIGGIGNIHHASERTVPRNPPAAYHVGIGGAGNCVESRSSEPLDNGSLPHSSLDVLRRRISKAFSSRSSRSKSDNESTVPDTKSTISPDSSKSFLKRLASIPDEDIFVEGRVLRGYPGLRRVIHADD